MTTCSFSGQTLLTPTYDAALQPPTALPPEASFGRDSPARQVESTDSRDGQADLAVKLREKANLG